MRTEIASADVPLESLAILFLQVTSASWVGIISPSAELLFSAQQMFPLRAKALSDGLVRRRLTSGAAVVWKTVALAAPSVARILSVSLGRLAGYRGIRLGLMRLRLHFELFFPHFLLKPNDFQGHIKQGHIWLCPADRFRRRSRMVVKAGKSW